MVYIQSLGVVKRYRINQAIPSVPTTLYDYWWPYDAPADTPTLAPLFTASDAASDVVASAQDVAISSGIPTASLIQITALPPATTSPQAVLPKLPYHRQLNILYLIPLFIALGVVLGAITIVIILKWREGRRRLLRTSTLLPGPPYVPPENDIEDRLLVHGYPSMEQVSLFAAGTPSKFTIHGSQYIPKRTLAWQTLDATLPRFSQPTYTQTIIPSSDGERFTVVTQDDPFLNTSPMVIQQSPKLMDDVFLPKICISSSLPDAASGANSTHHKAQATDLPKPFRRSMFDILKLKGLYRPVPSGRTEYNVLAPDDEPAEKTPTNRVRRVSSLNTTKMVTLACDSRPRSVHRSSDGVFYVSDVEDALGLLGSQDEKQDLIDPPVTHRLKDDTLSSPTQSETTRRPPKVTPFTSETKRSPKESTYSEDRSINPCRGNEIEEEKRPDIYTKAPQRRHSRTPHRGSSTGGASRRSSAPDTHASVLPLSPPSLMSPPLEKSLFFTSSLSSSSASLANRMNTLAAINSSPLHHVDRSPEFSLFPLPSKTKATKRLRPSRPEPPLPYPSYPDHVHAQRTPKERSTSANTKRRYVSPGSPKPKGPSTSATSRDSTTGICSLGSLSPTSLVVALASSSSSDILNKVNDILAQGYTKKRTSMGGGEHVARNLPDSI
ncbi:hypothetical protein J3R82DRAFT_2870 [Butyriboletus roseoflavus]|nr:hypothetical protein J3R82DRAFT_2870 [Butyriboletus roseoflavus]